jgi:hypothetical protein
MPRFVILLHETQDNTPRPTHFDLVFEHAGVLRTWATEKLPTLSEAVIAERLADHRLAYLDYDGEISGGRGRVSRVEEGHYDVIEETESNLVLRIRGAKLTGTLTLTALTGDSQRSRVSLSSG